MPTKLKGILVTPEDVSAKHGKKVSLGELAQKNTLVLYFYPKDDTPGCTTEALGFRDKYSEFEKRGVKIIGVSRDGVESHCKFMSKHSLNFPLLVDESGEICEAFGVWVEKKMYGKTYMGIERTTFIVDGGKIVKVFPKVKVKNHAEEILEYLDSREK